MAASPPPPETMQKLIDELTRLYLPSPTGAAALQRQLAGQTVEPVALVGPDGLTRAAVVDFRKLKSGDPAQHWNLLCQLANAVQTELGLPAPAVSISGADGYRLWISLESATPVGLVRQFLELLRDMYCPALVLHDPAPSLPPCLDAHTGKWAAFIHPDLGASFADDSGLEMAPPLAGQAALLDGLHSISAAQLQDALERLQPLPAAPQDAAAFAPAPALAPAPAPAPAIRPGLLLQDATLEDIVRHLHARHIEPTFRHLIDPDPAI